MERKILHISSYRRDIVETFSDMIRKLGRRAQRPLWGIAFTPEEEVTSLLYLDSGGRGNLDLMAKSMEADVIEFMFILKETGQPYFLISELLRTECKAGEHYYKSTEKANEIIGKRVKTLDGFMGKSDFFIADETPFERSRIYSARKSEIKRNIVNGNVKEGALAELFNEEELPRVILCDAFTKNGALAIMEKALGRPLCVHIMSGDKNIYAPVTALEREIFIDTEEFIKEALSSICLWLMDNGEMRSKDVLYEAFVPLRRGEELIERTITRFMKVRHKKRRVKDEH